MADGSANKPVTSRPVKQELAFQYIYTFVYFLLFTYFDMMHNWTYNVTVFFYSVGLALKN